MAKLWTAAIILCALVTPAVAAWNGTWRASNTGGSDIQLPTFLFDGPIRGLVDQNGNDYGTAYDGDDASSLSVRQYEIRTTVSPYSYLKKASQIVAPTYHIDRPNVGITTGLSSSDQDYYGICRASGAALHCVDMFWNPADNAAVRPMVAKIEASFSKTQFPSSAAASPVSPSLQTPAQIVKLYYQADSACRGSPNAIQACAARTGYSSWLHQAGWCDKAPGHEDEDYTDWHPCVGTTLATESSENSSPDADPRQDYKDCVWKYAASNPNNPLGGCQREQRTEMIACQQSNSGAYTQTCIASMVLVSRNIADVALSGHNSFSWSPLSYTGDIEDNPISQYLDCTLDAWKGDPSAVMDETSACLDTYEDSLSNCEAENNASRAECVAAFALPIEGEN